MREAEEEDQKSRVREENNLLGRLPYLMTEDYVW